MRPINVWGTTTEPIQVNEEFFPITQELLIVKLLKQRFEFPEVSKWALGFDIDNLKLWAMTSQKETMEW
jgi:hypothetical protein